MNNMKTINVLILCTGNSARSVLAEAILARHGAGRFCAFSAGSKPAGKVNPYALRLLEAKGYDISGFRSKSWDEFAHADAPQMDIVITVCSNAAGETCPLWPGAPVRVHSGYRDPAAATGSDADIMAAFEDAYASIDAFMKGLVALDIENMDAAQVKAALQAIASND